MAIKKVIEVSQGFFIYSINEHKKYVFLKSFCADYNRAKYYITPVAIFFQNIFFDLAIGTLYAIESLL